MRFIGCGYKRAHNYLKLPPRKGYHIKIYCRHMAYSENHYQPLPPEVVPISEISAFGPLTMLRSMLRKKCSFHTCEWAKTLAGTDRSDIPRYLLQSDFEPFPFQSGTLMARFQSVEMTQYFQISVNRGSSLLIMGLHQLCCYAADSGSSVIPLFFLLQPISRLPSVG